MPHMHNDGLTSCTCSYLITVTVMNRAEAESAILFSIHPPVVQTSH